MNIKYFLHFHKKFKFDYSSSWMQATKFEENLDTGGDAICLSAYSPSIAEIFEGIESDQYRIGYYAQTIATEYWILKHLTDVDYVGVSGYRRYPIFNPNIEFQESVKAIDSTIENLKLLSHDSNLKYIIDILKLYDVIIPKHSANRIPINKQFIDAQQSTEIWEAFINAVESLSMEYKRNIDWFSLPQYSHFYGPMGLTPLVLYKEYIYEYIEIVKIILKTVQCPFFIIDPAAGSYSDRWIGYLAERFYPFFLHIRKVTKFQVPIALVYEPVSTP